MTLIEAIRIARDEWEWLAIDYNGEVFAYNGKPVMAEYTWLIADDGWDAIRYDFIGLGRHTGTPINWKKSLIRLTDIKVC